MSDPTEEALEKYLPQWGTRKVVGEEVGQVLVKLESQLADKDKEIERLANEWLCKECNCIHPTQGKGINVQACPDCGSEMYPTSFDRRRADEAEAKLERARELIKAADKFVGAIFHNHTLQPELRLYLDAVEAYEQTL